MGYKMKGSSFYSKKSESPAKQTYTTPEMLKEKNDAEIDLNTSLDANGKRDPKKQDRYDKAAAGFIQKNEEENDRRKAEGRPVVL